VLMDFGTGREVARELEAPAAGVDGPAIYMAPEVLMGEPASYSSDTYSVGVVLYHVLTAAYPVEGASLSDLKTAHRAGLRTPLGVRRPDLPPSFVRVVERALAPKAERYATPAALCDDLEHVSGGRGSRVYRVLGGLAAAAAGLIIAFTVLGFITTLYFNSSLGRLEFVDEGFWDWLKWGAKSTLAPITTAALALVIASVILESIRLLFGMATKSYEIERSIAAFVHRHLLDDVRVISAISLLASVILLVGACWYFAELLSAFTIYPDISTVPIDRIRLLSPDFAEFQWAYRKTFSTVTTATMTLWYPAVRLAIRTRRPIPRHVAIGGGIVLAISLILLDFPYRLLTHDIDFHDVSWSGHTCQLLGQRGEDRLIFCPDFEPPRSRTVRSDSVVVDPASVSDPIVVWDVADAKRKRSVFRFLMRTQRAPE
jgi:protein kinase-like protein